MILKIVLKNWLLLSFFPEHEASCDIVLTCTMQLSLIKTQKALQLYTAEWKLQQNEESGSPVRAAAGAAVTPFLNPKRHVRT